MVYEEYLTTSSFMQLIHPDFASTIDVAAAMRLAQDAASLLENAAIDNLHTPSTLPFSGLLSGFRCGSRLSDSKERALDRLSCGENAPTHSGTDNYEVLGSPAPEYTA